MTFTDFVQQIKDGVIEPKGELPKKYVHNLLT